MLGVDLDMGRVQNAPDPLEKEVTPLRLHRL